MAFKYDIPTVSSITDPTEYAKARISRYHEYYDQKSRDFADAVCSALGGASYVFASFNEVIIYRPTDTHILGEIGFKDLRIRLKGTLRGTNEVNNRYYVRAYNIENDKVGSDNWQHHTYSFKSMSAAVKCAVKYLLPLTPIQVVEVNRLRVDKIIQDVIFGHRRPIDRAGRDLFGSGFYHTHLDTPIFQELRNTTFLSPEVNKQVATFFSCDDELIAAMSSVAKGLFYVSTVSDGAVHIPFSAGFNALPPTTQVYAELPEWIQGRIAVLRMVEPETYVLGVGLRLDDKMFYAVGSDADDADGDQ